MKDACRIGFLIVGLAVGAGGVIYWEYGVGGFLALAVSVFFALLAVQGSVLMLREASGICEVWREILATRTESRLLYYSRFFGLLIFATVGIVTLVIFGSVIGLIAGGIDLGLRRGKTSVSIK